LLTGELSSAGELISNNHIARTLLHMIGIEDDVGDYRKGPVLAMLEDE
jgi:hypothetical protein